MFSPLSRSIAVIACPALLVGSLHATDYTWKGGGDTTNILDPARWVGGIVPANDGTNINLTATDRILFAQDSLPLEETSATLDPQINVPVGAQIVVNTGATAAGVNANKVINVRVAMAGNGPDGNGALYVQSTAWGQPQFTVLTGATSVTVTGQRFRIDGGPNRLDLAGNTLTTRGTGETNLVNTNVYNTTGTIVSNQIFSVEGSTRIDPGVTVDMAAGTLYTSWDGNNNRREQATIMRNLAAIETRKVDRDLTFTGPLTVNAGDTGIFRAQIQNVGQPGDTTDQRLNMMSPITGAGIIRQDGDGTLTLSGNNTHTGGTILNGAAASAVVAASNTAFGTGPVTVATPSTVHLSNAGGLEFRDDLQRGDPLPAPTAANVVNPALTGLHSVQAYDNTRWSYTGKINNATAGNVVYSFVEQYDDDVFLSVDGVTVLNDNGWNTATNGQATLTPGEHDIRISVRNGGGGAGPNSGFEAVGFAYGVGMTTALPLGGATNNAADYTGIGSSYQVYQNTNRTFTNPFVLNAPLALTTSQMNGYTATVSGPISGANGLVVRGSPAFATDQLILSGANTYAGDTTIEAGGSLRLAGSHTSAANYNVNAGAVLSVTGVLSVTDPATPNVPADLLITNAGTAGFTGSASLNLELFADAAGANASLENDKLLAGGPITLTLGGALNVGNPNNIATFSFGDTWDLFDWNTAPTGTFGTVNLPVLPGNLQWNSSDIYTGGTISIVPEPSVAGLLALLGGALGLRRRRV